jgi:RNA polymerase sigma factor (sigma-70 family)
METPTSQSLEMLLQRARDGSRSALGQLMASCRPWLRDRAQARLPRKLSHKQDESDLVQECQSVAALSFSRFKGRNRHEFFAWLAGILDRRVLRAMRFWATKRRNGQRELPQATARSELAASSTALVDRLARSEEFERLRLAASWCRPDDLELIAKHLFEAHSHEDIASDLGVGTAAVRQRYCRAVRRVGKALQLQQVMTEHGLDGTRQDLIGLHRCQGADIGGIAAHLCLPKDLIARWIAEAKPLFRQIDEDRS